MKAKTRFIKMYWKLPVIARRELVINFAVYPMSVNVCYQEINNNTKLGNKILKQLGYEDD